MTFLDFIINLPFSQVVAYILGSLFIFLVAFGIYKFVKDWLPW